jgi:hypothetical protein
MLRQRLAGRIGKKKAAIAVGHSILEELMEVVYSSGRRSRAGRGWPDR